MAARILVADDSPNIREILQVSLESAGYTVLLAEDGEQAMQLFQKDHPDLMIVDIMMPRLNGFQVCRKVKTSVATAIVPVILLTARSQDEDIFWGKDCGADEYITKPFSTRELERTVERLLKQRHDRENGVGDGVKDEHRRRRGLGQASEIINLSWDARAMDVYRKKYGEFRFVRALSQVRQAVEKYLEETRDRGPVELHDTFGVTLVLRGAPDEALQRATALAERLNALAVSLYDEEDRGRGYIPFRDPRRPKEKNVSLLSFSPSLAPEVAA